MNQNLMLLNNNNNIVFRNRLKIDVNKFRIDNSSKKS